MIRFERDDILKQTKLILKHYRNAGGIFGDSNAADEKSIYKSIVQALPDIAKYCKNYGIDIKGFQESLKYVEK